MQVVADKDIKDCKGETWDVIALPGGMPGAEHLRDNQVLEEILKEPPVSFRAQGEADRYDMVIYSDL